MIRARGEEDDGAARSRAIMAYCAMVGAISVARAVSDEKLSREILKTVAHLLNNPAHKVAPDISASSMPFRKLQTHLRFLAVIAV